MAKRETVFVTNKSPDHDYTSATKFGSLRFVTSGNYPVFKTARLIEEITDVLVYSEANDYILPSGSATIAAIVLTIWLEMHSQARILLWDRTQSSYVLREIDKQSIRLGIESTKDKLKVAR